VSSTQRSSFAIVAGIRSNLAVLINQRIDWNAERCHKREFSRNHFSIPNAGGSGAVLADPIMVAPNSDDIRTAKLAGKDVTIGNMCGACGAVGKYGRVNYTTLPKSLSVYPGKGLDQEEDFVEWSLSELRSRVELISRFDQACDEIRDNFIALIGSCKVVEEVVMIAKTVKRIECCHV
jgi:hypothetical protein